VQVKDISDLNLLNKCCRGPSPSVVFTSWPGSKLIAKSLSTVSTDQLSRLTGLSFPTSILFSTAAQRYSDPDLVALNITNMPPCLTMRSAYSLIKYMAIGRGSTVLDVGFVHQAGSAPRGPNALACGAVLGGARSTTITSCSATPGRLKSWITGTKPSSKTRYGVPRVPAETLNPASRRTDSTSGRRSTSRTRGRLRILAEDFAFPLTGILRTNTKLRLIRVEEQCCRRILGAGE
jgi:hypothetical protein